MDVQHVSPRRSSPRIRHWRVPRIFYADIKRQARAFDRSPDQIKILPGISPFIGSTQLEADRLQEEFNDLIQPEYSLTQLRQMLGLDLSGFDLDDPFPRHLIDTGSAHGVASRFKLVIDIVDREKPTLRQLVQRVAGARGHWVIAGPPEKIADNIQTWFENGAADGFNVMPPCLPVDSTSSPSRSCRSCASAVYSGTTTQAKRCAITTAWTGQQAFSPIPFRPSRSLPDLLSCPSAPAFSNSRVDCSGST